VLALLLVPLVGGCAGAGNGEDKAGGRPPRGVLSIAVPDPAATHESQLARQFAATVRRLSRGKLRLEIRYLAGGDHADAEPRAIDQVRDGDADLGWIAARAWDERGVTTLRALQAPFLITNYALLDAVLRSSTGTRMLFGLRRAGVVPLALVPGLLRHPVGIRRLFRGVSDFRGARIRVFPSRVTDALMRALGATPVHLSASGVVRDAVDGDELALFPAVDGIPTVNVLFFPKVITVFANRSTYHHLSKQMQAVLLEAARDVERSNTSFPVRQAIAYENVLIRQYCTPGRRVATATPTELAALRRSTRSVYAELDRDPRTAAAIRAIRRLARDLPHASPVAAPPRCLTQSIAASHLSTGARLLDGTYRHVLTAAGAIAFGPPATNPGNHYPMVITTVLRGGRWIANSSEPPDGGTYRISGDRITFTLRSDTMRFTFRRTSGGLILTPVPGMDPGDAWIMSGSEWRRLGKPISRLP